ncbi:MAG: hypothetical protein QUS13_05205 [Smithella sp.]|nr:hypothetical protein [Smithella sp.]
MVTVIFSLQVSETNDLIYEGIATFGLNTIFWFSRVETNDLIYEGIATAATMHISFVAWKQTT